LRKRINRVSRGGAANAAENQKAICESGILPRRAKRQKQVSRGGQSSHEASRYVKRLRRTGRLTGATIAAKVKSGVVSR